MTPLPRSGWADQEAGRSRSPALPLLRDVASALWSVLVAGVAFSAGLAVAGIESVRSFPLLLLALAVGFALMELVLSPILRRIAARGSAILAMVLGLGAQLALFGVVVLVAVGGSGVGWWQVGQALIVAAAILALGRWLVGSTDSGYIVGAATRRRTTARTGGRGLLVVQLDGVSPQVLDRAIEAGQAPNLARWLGSTHRMDTWWKTIPSTTPATMAGVLHGDDAQVPAFRWWDRESGRLLAVSRPSDARLIENRFVPGRGLLRDGGTAISTTFGGEASQAYLTISHATGSRGLGSGATYVNFFSRPFLLPGALVLTVGEMIKELYQARRQKVRGVEPRISRSGSYVALRGLTNVLLRKLNLSLIAQEMAAGRPIIFVDFVDYDEIAHHAGPERPESMRALEGLDGALALLQQVAHSSNREYELVVISDHGQSLGDTFAQLTGTALPDHVASLMTAQSDHVSVLAHTAGEEWGPINALINSLVSKGDRMPDGPVLGPDRDKDDAPSELPEVAVTGGGNLGMVWFPRLPHRPTLGEVTQHWPRLIPGLVATPGVGLVMVTNEDHEPIVFGPTGARALVTGAVDGDDPLVGYPSRTAPDLIRLHGVSRSGDLVIISTVDERGRIHAFENQVGSHGGIGGPQNHALLVHPAAWPLHADLLTEVDGAAIAVGPVALHQQFDRWRAALNGDT
ncbi:type I phosphodiesterase/nucleotide pyrophosphatase [Branchiibius hedensis]|uniref:Type I phosphodiesterase / nucleotide pyrophosphatase n=1 Tax=Branchiibius hedensis TaxID=672460 RepID=A0A2Y8ZQS5_9MICO|nr:alkaline phosphatase family protein [Branchiibius hedensis]PWJ24940.1 type I phosphodiesterase/nucleotide pyrophosphatase [Branchiibius hedensis]SSA33756.1 Type I phosphodiesterase / nucleotide pyrophosphatase [Branchiibius hedensis]